MRVILRVLCKCTFGSSNIITVCIPESFNTNISHQLFDPILTFVNSQHSNTYSKGNLVHKTSFKDFLYTKINPTQSMTNSINNH